VTAPANATPVPAAAKVVVVEAVPPWLWGLAGGLFAAGIIVGLLAMRYITLARMDPVARAFVLSREVALVVRRDGTVEGHPLRRVSSLLAVSRLDGTYVVPLTSHSVPLVTPGARTVWLALDAGRVGVPLAGADAYTQLCAVHVMPEGCERTTDPACWERLAEAAGELGGQFTLVGPLRIAVSVDRGKILDVLGESIVAKGAAQYESIQASMLAVARTETLWKALLGALRGQSRLAWVVLLAVIVIAAIMAVVVALR
jgi:hypothetical protein